MALGRFIVWRDKIAFKALSNFSSARRILCGLSKVNFQNCGALHLQKTKVKSNIL